MVLTGVPVAAIPNPIPWPLGSWQPADPRFPLNSINARRLDRWCKSFSVLVKESTCTRCSYWMWQIKDNADISALSSTQFIYLFHFFFCKMNVSSLNGNFTFLKCISTRMSSGASLHHCWQISTGCKKFSCWKSRLHLPRWGPQHGCD